MDSMGTLYSKMVQQQNGAAETSCTVQQNGAAAKWCSGNVLFDGRGTDLKSIVEVLASFFFGTFACQWCFFPAQAEHPSR